MVARQASRLSKNRRQKKHWLSKRGQPNRGNPPAFSFGTCAGDCFLRVLRRACGSGRLYPRWTGFFGAAGTLPSCWARGVAAEERNHACQIPRLQPSASFRGERAAPVAAAPSHTPGRSPAPRNSAGRLNLLRRRYLMSRRTKNPTRWRFDT
jgi:hypothetical protein